VIVDLQKFLDRERPLWDELDSWLHRLEEDPERRLSLAEASRVHYLYRRSASDLAQLASFAAEPRLRLYLENLVARAYGEVHEIRSVARRAHPLRWCAREFPRAFRRRWRAFLLATAALLLGAALRMFFLAVDADAKRALLPFSHLQGDPRERVASEESGERQEALAGGRISFSSTLMTHNLRVAIGALALGLTWGVGTLLLLFYNGIILGAVALDYLQAGQGIFLAGWLLPHGTVEIPACLMAGQAGLVLAGALVGRGWRQSLGDRLREVRDDLVALMAGVAVMLVWAGVVEAFLSQYHQPVLPYPVKIAFGLAELAGLAAFLVLAGRPGSNDVKNGSDTDVRG